MWPRTFFLCLVAVAEATLVDKTFIIALDPASSLLGRSLDPHTAFHKRAEHLQYTVRHEFKDADSYLGLSVKVRSSGFSDEIKAQLKAIPGVRSVAQVERISIPIEFNTTVDPFQSFPNPPPFKQAKQPVQSGNLGSALQMGGVDKLHKRGIKGKGIKIGIVDTGIDYRHPALGNGFGPGHKIAGGYSFVSDNGTNILDPDPLTTCYGGGHGTHVAGQLMEIPHSMHRISHDLLDRQALSEWIVFLGDLTLSVLLPKLVSTCTKHWTAQDMAIAITS